MSHQIIDDLFHYNPLISEPDEKTALLMHICDCIKRQIFLEDILHGIHKKSTKTGKFIQLRVTNGSSQRISVKFVLARFQEEKNGRRYVSLRYCTFQNLAPQTSCIKNIGRTDTTGHTGEKIIPVIFCFSVILGERSFTTRNFIDILQEEETKRLYVEESARAHILMKALHKTARAVLVPSYAVAWTASNMIRIHSNRVANFYSPQNSCRL